MRIGDIDITNSILNLENDLRVIQQVLDYIVRTNPNLKRPSVDDIAAFKRIAINQLREKYPNMGIEEKQ